MNDPSRVSLLESVRVDFTMADRGLLFYEWRNSPTFVMATRRELLICAKG